MNCPRCGKRMRITDSHDIYYCLKCGPSGIAHGEQSRDRIHDAAIERAAKDTQAGEKVEQ